MVKEVGFLGLKEQQFLLGIALTLRTPCVPLLTWVVNVCDPEPFPLLEICLFSTIPVFSPVFLSGYVCLVITCLP